MSFTDEYLKLRQQQSTPTAEASLRPTGDAAADFASEYLRLRQQQSAQVQTTLPKVSAPAAKTTANAPEDEPEEEKGFWEKLREALGLTSTEEPKPTAQPTSAGDDELDAYLKQIQDNANKAVAIGEDRTAAQVGQYAARKAGAGAAESVEGLINEIGYVNNWLEEKLGGGDDGSAGARGSSFNATARSGFGNNREGTAPTTNTMEAGYTPNRDTVTFGDDYRKWVEENTSQEVKDSKAAQVVGDVAEGVGGMVPAILSNFILPGSSLYVMATGAAGNATQEAMNEGADSGKALMYGAAVGAVEAATEKMFDGVAGVFGGGAADDAIEGLVKKAVKNETAQKAVVKLAGVLGEGFEEFVSEFADRVANELIIDTDDRSFLSTLGDAGYSFLVGAAVSSFMQTAQGITNAAKADPKVLAQQAAESVKTQVESAKAQNGENSPSAPVAVQTGTDTAKSGNGQEGAPGSPGLAQGGPTTITVESGQSALNKPQGLAYMLASSIPQVSDMAPVKALTGNELNDRTKKPSEQIREFFAKIGNSVFRQGFGNVLFNEYGVGGMLNHRPLNRAKMVSLTAAPEVIQKGRIINDDPNWKGRGYRSITFAAPVSISGSTVYVAAVVDQRPDNKFYLTECVDSEGNYVRIKETPSGNTKSGVTAESGVTTGPERVPENTIPQSGPDYNRENNSQGGDGLGAADRGFAGETLDYQDWKDQTAPTELHDVSAEQSRNVQAQQGREAEALPRKDFFGRLTNKLAQTLINSGVTTDSMAESLKSAAANGAFSRLAYTDQAAGARAESRIGDHGWESALSEYRADVEKGLSSKDITAMGIALYNNAVTNGDNYTALDIASLMIQNASTTAQALQAYRMLNKLTPDGKLYMAVKSVDNIRRQLEAKYGDKAPNLNIDDGLLQEYRDTLVSGDEDAQKAAWAKIEQSVADQIPARWYEKLNAWRYLAMLGNPRTHIRNIKGNAGFAPVRLIKQGVAAGIERAALGKAGERSGRTKSVLNPASKQDRARITAAWADYSEVSEIIQSGGKYDQSMSGVEGRRTIYKNPVLEAARKGNSALLDIEDTWFSRPAYAEALASFMKARGISASDYAGDGISAEVKAEAQAYAVREAQKATYRDINQFSELVSKLGRVGKGADSGPVSKAVGTLVEGVLPFKKTPANILVRAVEYSPLEFGQVLFSDIAKVRKGSMAPAEMIDHIASGLTGTGLVALGALLRSLGLISGGRDDDEKQAAFDELQGKQEYALFIGDVNYTLDWLAPGALPLFVGSAVYDAFTEEDGDGGAFSRLMEALPNLAEPMLNMSMLSSVNDMIDAVSYADADSKLWSMMAQAGVSYLKQYVPTLFGQIERIGETERETTFIDRDSELSSDMQYTIGQTMNKLPGEYHQIPYIDAWGRTESTGSAWERTLNNLVNPAYVSKDASTPNDGELQRLYDAGFSNVFPERTAQSEKVDDVYMTAEEYTAYATTRGQTSLELITAFMNSAGYDSLSDEQRAEIISDLYSQAKSKAAEQIREMRGEKSKLSEKEKAVAAFKAGDMVTYLSYVTGYNALEDGATAQEAKAMETLLDQPMPDSVGRVIMEGDFAKMVQAEEAGVSVQDYFTVREAISGLTAAEGYENPALWQKLNAIGGTKLSDKDKLTMIKQYAGTEKAGERFQTAYDAGVPLDTVLAYYEAVNARNADGTAKSSLEKKTAVYALGLTDQQRVLLERTFG